MAAWRGRTASTGFLVFVCLSMIGIDGWRTYMARSDALVDAQTDAAVFAMSEPDIELAVVQPWVSFCNDSSGTSPEGLLGKEFPHPRAYGTFPRVLRKYVREERRLTLEEAIRKFTSLPASRLRLSDRGVIKTGLWADIVVFDPNTITERSTFQAPNQLSVGMQWVLVNGVPVIAEGAATHALPGQVLRGPGYRAHPADHSRTADQS